jgi:ABC-type transport system substrate-binding protein
MKKVFVSLIGFILLVCLPACAAGGVQASSATAGPTIPPPTAVPVVTGCSSALAVVKNLYTADSAGQLDASLALFSSDATFASWAQGINGHHMIEKHLSGLRQIRTVLGGPGLVYSSGAANAPIFKQTEVSASGSQLNFKLRPDRLRPNGRQYNPYQVQVVFDGCKIKSMTVIELVTWL